MLSSMGALGFGGCCQCLGKEATTVRLREKFGFALIRHRLGGRSLRNSSSCRGKEKRVVEVDR